MSIDMVDVLVLGADHQIGTAESRQLRSGDARDPGLRGAAQGNLGWLEGQLTLLRLRRPKEVDLAVPAKDGEVARTVIVEIPSGQVDRVGHADVEHLARQITPLTAPKDANNVAVGLAELPARPSEDSDVRPAVAVQIDHGHGDSSVDRQHAVDP